MGPSHVRGELEESLHSPLASVVGRFRSTLSWVTWVTWERLLSELSQLIFYLVRSITSQSFYWSGHVVKEAPGPRQLYLGAPWKISYSSNDRMVDLWGCCRDGVKIYKPRMEGAT